MALGRSDAVWVHGVRVAWMSAEGTLGEAITTLFAGFPPADPLAPADVLVTLTVATAATAADPASEGFRPSCFFGTLRGFVQDGEFLLWDGDSRVRVDACGTRIDAAIGQRARNAPRHFADVALFLAVIVALRYRGLFHVHAGGVIDVTGGVWLLVGGSGSGKTTTTLALVTHGLRYLGDDAILLRTDTAGFTEALAFPRAFHLTETTCAAFPTLQYLAQHAAHEGSDKRALDPRMAFPAKAVVAAAPPRLLLLPEVSSDVRTHLVAVSQADALGALLQSSPLVAANGMPRAFEQLAVFGALVRNVRAFRLYLGADALACSEVLLDRIAAAVGWNMPADPQPLPAGSRL